MLSLVADLSFLFMKINSFFKNFSWKQEIFDLLLSANLFMPCFLLELIAHALAELDQTD